MGISVPVNQLHIDPHLVSHFLHAAFEKVRYTKLPCDVAEIPWLALILLCGSARNYFQTRNASKPCQDLLVDAFSEIRIIWIRTKVSKGKHCNPACDRLVDKFALPNDPTSSCRQCD